MQPSGGGPPALRPLGVGEILDVAIKIYTRNLGTFIALVAIVLVPIGLLAILGYISLIPDGAFIKDDLLYFPVSESTSAYNTFSLVTVFLYLLGVLLATGVGTRAVAESYLGRKPSVGESYAYVGKRFHSLLWISFLNVVILAVAALSIFVLVGIVAFPYLAVALVATVPALVVENARGTKAISRSFNLVQGRWWATFGTVLLGVFLIPFVIIFAITFVLGLIGGSEDPTTFLVLQQTASTIGEVIATPIQVAVITVLYFDLRVRKEAFDLQLLAERVGSPPAMEGEPGATTTGTSTTAPSPETPPPPSG